MLIYIFRSFKIHVEFFFANILLKMTKRIIYQQFYRKLKICKYPKFIFKFISPILIW